MKTKIFLIGTLISILVSACAAPQIPPQPTPLATEPAFISGMAVVQEVEVQILETQPLQANAVVRGALPDSCTQIDQVNQTRQDKTFQITLTTLRPVDGVCTTALVPFEEIVPLDMSNLPPAEYQVSANGVVQSFDIAHRDVEQFKQVLVEALNARDYDVLQTLMGESFMLALWRSEGTAYTPAQAIEQLRTNYFDQAGPVNADDDKDLSALLGSPEPFSIFGLDETQIHGLFISGFGRQGQDEAVLLLARLPDGSLYWHGILFAIGGFDDSGEGAGQPAGAPVFPTQVEFVLAQQDVVIYSGPDSSFAALGQIFSGQMAKVTGTNADGSWWRVICPDDSVGSCWVSADPSLTQPTSSVGDDPLSEEPVLPTNVQFVIAQRDVSILNGPGIQYAAVGTVAAGQMAKVTGTNADGSWWRVMCPDDTVGSCWVSADPSLTQPTDPPG